MASFLTVFLFVFEGNNYLERDLFGLVDVITCNLFLSINCVSAYGGDNFSLLLVSSRLFTSKGIRHSKWKCHGTAKRGQCLNQIKIIVSYMNILLEHPV
ncbi:MAG: hypothetical protein CMF66_09900 [Magnetovibrio sp.]|nr:hypothetical protein [Magnetovibrio sp.]